MSILAGVRAARAAYLEATGQHLKEIAIDPREYMDLCAEVNVPRMQFGLLPTVVEIDDCEVWSR